MALQFLLELDKKPPLKPLNERQKEQLFEDMFVLEDLRVWKDIEGMMERGGINEMQAQDIYTFAKNYGALRLGMNVTATPHQKYQDLQRGNLTQIVEQFAAEGMNENLVRWIVMRVTRVVDEMPQIKDNLASVASKSNGPDERPPQRSDRTI